jgi:hypothetical protein
MNAGAITPLRHVTGGSPLVDGIRQICAALAMAGLGGLAAEGQVLVVQDDRMPMGYDPVTHQIWMDERWQRGLEAFLSGAVSEPGALAFHALVHEHVHVNSPINGSLHDPGFLDPRQRFLEEACVDALAQRVTERLVGRRFDHPTYGPMVETLEWLSARTRRDVAFLIWREDTLTRRVRRANAAVQEALRLPPRGGREARWLTRFREVLEREHEHLHQLLDAPGLLQQAARAVASPRPAGRLPFRLPARDRSRLVDEWRGALQARRTRRS